MRCLRKDCIHEVHTCGLLPLVTWGPLGLYKFYLGRPFMGLLYIFTCGGFFWAGSAIFSPYHTRSRWPIFCCNTSLSGRVLPCAANSSTSSISSIGSLQVTPVRPLRPGVNLCKKVKPRFTDDELMLQLLRAAQKHGGRLSVTQGVIETGVLFGEVERVLQSMVKSNYVYMDNDPATGVIVYVFKEIF